MGTKDRAIFDKELADKAISETCRLFNDMGLNMAEAYFASNVLARCSGAMLKNESDATRKLVDLLTYTEEDVEAAAAITDVAAASQQRQ